MIEASDLKRLKEANEKLIVDNNSIIDNIKSKNCELEAENRVFDKLITLYEPKETVENVENI